MQFIYTVRYVIHCIVNRVVPNTAVKPQTWPAGEWLRRPHPPPFRFSKRVAVEQVRPVLLATGGDVIFM